MGWRGPLTLGALALGALSGGIAPARGEDLPPFVQRALEDEARRVALLERLAPSVASVFPGEVAGHGGGSGVIIDPAGYVLTNFHVAGTEPIQTVGLNDGRTHRARLLGIDPGGDLALLKLVEDREWPAVPLGDSDALRPGERVFALGNPFLLAEDFAPTVTEGVISGVHRYRDATGGSDLVYGDSIQIDASINPGNSGGPLFDAAGRLIGINGLGGFRPDRGRVNVGVGFAASIEQIKNFLLDLRASRQCQHGTMNATVRDVAGEQGAAGQVVVDAIARESTAWNAGLRLGDVVRAFEGVAITTQNQLLTRISRLPAGRRVTLEVQRDEAGERRELQVTFRLDPLWSGPGQGQWRPDPALVQAETRRILALHRASRTLPASGWTLETRGGALGAPPISRVLRVLGRKLRLEEGPARNPRVEVWDGARGWTRTGGGAVAPLPPARRDLLAGTAEALSALAEEGGERRLSELVFTGGERLAGRLVIRLETRDAAGRRRKLYLDPTTHVLVGLAYPEPGEQGGERWVEESLRYAPGEAPYRRVDDASGAVLEEGRATFSASAPAASLFEEGAR